MSTAGITPFVVPNAWHHVVIAGIKTPGKANVSGWARKNEYDSKKGKGTAGATQTLKAQPPASGTIDFWVWTDAQMRAWDRIDARLAYKPHATGTTPTPAATSEQQNQGQQFAQNTSGVASTGSASGTIPDPSNTSGTSAGAQGQFGAGQTAAKDNSGGVTLTKDDAIDIYHPALHDIGVFAVLPPEELGAWEEDGEGTALYKRTIKFVEFAQASQQSIAATPTGAQDGSQDPSQQQAGSQESAAPGNGANSQAGAGQDAQNAWGGGA
jgi:hypothetical protein